MAEPTRHTVTVADVGPDRGHGSLPRRHPADTTGTGEYFHGIDDLGRHPSGSIWSDPCICKLGPFLWDFPTLHTIPLKGIVES